MFDGYVIDVSWLCGGCVMGVCLFSGCWAVNVWLFAHRLRPSKIDGVFE